MYAVQIHTFIVRSGFCCREWLHGGHVEKYADFWDKNPVCELKLRSLTVTFFLEDDAQRKGQTRAELCRTFLHGSHFKERQCYQLPKGWTFWGGLKPTWPCPLPVGLTLLYLRACCPAWFWDPVPAVPAAAVSRPLLLHRTNSSQARQSPPGAADNRCLIKHLSTLQAFALTRTKLTLNHSLITAKLY